MKKYFWHYLFPGMLLIGCAFWVGLLENMVFAFLGFLSFFLAGVALIIEGRRKKDFGKEAQCPSRGKGL